ncbi:alpha/beta fold hydrolase [Streptacidiphilus cavernicola]|uniref:Alpha/beta fold hydrolase n=1 Tax=Streptacidiphilus cavernicola TaxID=3342716 RepID=A0ABV6W488_9ACTN
MNGLHLRVEGSADAPALLLLHGTGGSSAWWEPVVPALARDYRVIRLELAGHGRSPAAAHADGYTILAQAAAVAEALEQLGVTRLAGAVGHSTGGSVVTALAEARPGTVAALALIDTCPSAGAALPDSLVARLLLAPFPGRLLWRAFAGTLLPKAFASAFARPGPVPEALVDGSREMTHRALAATSRASLRYLEQGALPDRLARSGLPVLVVVGTEDRRWRTEAAADYRGVPGLRLELLPGVGHTPMYEATETVVALLRAFLAGAAG